MRVNTVVSVVLFLQLGATQTVAAQFTAGSRELFALDLSADQVGDVPTSVKMLQGNVEIVMKDGARMIKASERATFLINLPERLPPQFTLEFELTPKSCCQPEDLAFEGTPAINQGEYSMNFQWSRESLRGVGGGEGKDTPMPPAVAVMLPSQLTTVQVMVDGEAFQVYTNDELVADWPNRKFVRGRVLRVFLGGQDEFERAVYLSKLRIATNAPAPARP